MGSVGLPELIIIFTIALIVFGPRKLPDLGRSLGKSIAEFKKASNELRSTLDEEIRAEERRAAQQQAAPVPAAQPPAPAVYAQPFLTDPPASRIEDGTIARTQLPGSPEPPDDTIPRRNGAA